MIKLKLLDSQEEVFEFGVVITPYKLTDGFGHVMMQGADYKKIESFARWLHQIDPTRIFLINDKKLDL